MSANLFNGVEDRGTERTLRDLASLPKAHLHLHIGMAMRPATFTELGLRAGLSTQLPPVEATTLASFAGVGQTLASILSRPDNWRRFFDELLADHAAHGAVYVEPSLPLQVYADYWPSEEHFLAAMIALADEYAHDHGVSVGFMIPVDRTNDSPDRAEELAKLAARYRGQGVVSFGLHGDEGSRSAEGFASAFAIAHDAGLIVAPHAGETMGAPWVEATLDGAGPHRIQHGVRSVESRATIERLVRQQVCLDVCPTSNVVLGVTPDLTQHPLPALIRAGIACSVNADDPLVFRTTLLKEYELCRTIIGLDDTDIADVARSSIAFSGASDEIKQRAIAGIDRWMAAS